MLLEGLVGEREVGLVERHRSADAADFAELYERYYPRLTRFCRRRVRDAFTAEELAQEAFVRAYAAFARLDDEARFYPWLTVIAKRLIIDHYRRSGRTVATAEVDPGVVEGAETMLIQVVGRQEIWRALGSVGPRHQEVLRLRDVEGLSYEAIAQHLGAPTTTVPPLIHRARKALRREYLALTAAERAIAAPPFSFGLWLEVRRLRDRLMQNLAYLPDPHVLAAPAAAMALAVGGLMPFPSGGFPTGDEGATDALTTLARGHGAGSVPAVPRGGAPIASPTRAAASDEPKHQVVANVARITTDPDQARKDRQGDRRAPIYVEHGDHWVAANPQGAREDVEMVLAGDTDPVEAACDVSEHGC